MRIGVDKVNHVQPKGVLGVPWLTRLWECYVLVGRVRIADEWTMASTDSWVAVTFDWQIWLPPVRRIAAEMRLAVWPAGGGT